MLGNGSPQFSQAMVERLFDKRVVILDMAISEEVAPEVIAKLLFLQSRSSYKPITLLINSLGGFVSSGMAIVDTIRELDPLVHTCCKGETYAMAAIILGSGALGGRSAVRHAKIGFRRPEGPLNTSEQERKRITQVLIQKTLEMTRISEAALRDLFNSGKDLNPTQALDLGIIDHIVEQCIPAPS